MQEPICGEIGMPDFTELQLEAKQLPKKITGIFNKTQSGIGCITLFKASILDNSVLVAARTIEMTAISLDKRNDLPLMRYLQKERVHGLLNWDEFFEFKTKVLVGCYLFKWKQNNTLINSESQNFLIKLMKNDLDAKALTDMSPEYIDSCLDHFSQYCSFVYAHQHHSDYSTLYKQLGDDIQPDIHAVRYPTDITSSILFDVFHVGMQTIGMQ
jgi:hypothetical protein